MLASEPLETVQDVVREACLHDAVLLVRHAELLLDDRRATLRHAVAGAMADGRLWVVLTTRGEVADLVRMAPGTQLLRLEMPSYDACFRAWSWTRQIIGRPDVKIHDLRHSRASSLARSGASSRGAPRT